MQIKSWIPNILTLANLACGFVAILLLMTLPLEVLNPWWIAVLMLGALVFDFMDGGVARMLKVSSPMGKELDSLADMVTFGVLPGILAFKIILGGFSHAVVPGWHTTVYSTEQILLVATAVLIPIFSCIRLAKFNIDTRQTDKFIGMPTPTNALIWLSLFLIFKLDTAMVLQGDFLPSEFGQPTPWAVLVNPVPAAILAGITSVLLVVNLPLIALKFKNLNLKDNLMRYLLLAGAAVLIGLFTYKSVPLIVVYYFILSIIDNLVNKQNEVHS